MNIDDIIKINGKLKDCEKKSSFFTIKNPRDIINGTYHGLGNITKGFIGGITGLVAIPYIHIKNKGSLGIFKGLGLGFTSSISLPIIGTLKRNNEITN